MSMHIRVEIGGDALKSTGGSAATRNSEEKTRPPGGPADDEPRPSAAALELRQALRQVAGLGGGGDGRAGARGNGSGPHGGGRQR